MDKYINKQKLNSFSKSLIKTRSALGKNDITSITKAYGIAGNTFRAYTGWRVSPSDVYRVWAKNNTDKLIKSPPTKITSNKEGFKKWHKSLYDSLNRYWKKKQGAHLSVAHCYKLIDLYIKWLSQFDFGDSRFVKNINKYASCALDRQTIEKINQCYSKCLPIS